MSGNARRNADDFMLRASKAFARNKLQSAYELYGDAVAEYGRCDEAPRDRVALAWYTRAMLAINGDAVGDVAEDLEKGEAAVAEDFDQAVRDHQAGGGRLVDLLLERGLLDRFDHGVGLKLVGF